MRKGFLILMLMILAGAALCQGPNRTPTNNPGGSRSRTDIIPGSQSTTPAAPSFPGRNSSSTPIDSRAINPNGFLALVSRFGYYPVVSYKPILPQAKPEKEKLGVREYMIIDARPDNQKVGFLPVDAASQRKGMFTVGVQIKNNLAGWLHDDHITQYFEKDSSANRILVVAINTFWFTGSSRETKEHPRGEFTTTLEYDIDLFINKEGSYYPQKKISGSFSGPYQDGNAFHHLLDSALHVLDNNIRFVTANMRESEKNLYSGEDFSQYYNRVIRKEWMPQKIQKGLYLTYDDYLAGRPVCDSVEQIIRFNDYHRTDDYACQIIAYENNEVRPARSAWGFYDGRNLFVNAGGGLYLRLFSARNNHTFFHAQNLLNEKLGTDIKAALQIGQLNYAMLKKVSKAYNLTFQLDPHTGKLM
jgi:hypothetical protein